MVLGKVESGMIKQYDELTLLPSGSKVMIKSIQMHDDPATVANSPATVDGISRFVKCCNIYHRVFSQVYGLH